MKKKYSKLKCKKCGGPMMMDGVSYYKKVEHARLEYDPSCLDCGYIDYEWARKNMPSRPRRNVFEEV